MGLLSWIRREKVKPEEAAPQSITHEIETKKSLNPETETQLVLAELKGLYLFLRQHDARLEQHDRTTIEYLTEILIRKKVIPEDRKSEVEKLIAEGLEENKGRQSIVEQLQAAGLSRASAYRYTEGLGLKHETEIKANLTGETETKTQSQV
jgi:hypothetical protein